MTYKSISLHNFSREALLEYPHILSAVFIENIKTEVLI